MLTIGIISIVFGTLFITMLFVLRKYYLKDKVCLFYTLFFFPGLVQIFAGAVALSINKYLTISILLGACMIICWVISLFMFIYMLFKRDKYFSKIKPIN